jgi:hypothetical protein
MYICICISISQLTFLISSSYNNKIESGINSYSITSGTTKLSLFITDLNLNPADVYICCAGLKKSTFPVLTMILNQLIIVFSHNLFPGNF